MRTLLLVLLLADAARVSLCRPDGRSWTTEWPDLDARPYDGEPERLPLAPEWCLCVDVRDCASARPLLIHHQRHLLANLTCAFRGFMPFVCCDRVQSLLDQLPSEKPPCQHQPETPTKSVDPPCPCSVPARDRTDANVVPDATPPTYIGTAEPPIMPRTHFGQTGTRQQPPNTSGIPAHSNEVFIRESWHDEHGNGNTRHPMDSSGHRVPNAYDLGDDTSIELDKRNHMLHRPIHVVIPTLPTYQPTPYKPTPTGLFLVSVTPLDVHRWDVNPVLNGLEPSKRTTPPVKPRENDVKTIHYGSHSVEQETSVEDDMSSARRSVNPKRTSPSKNPCENDVKTVHHNWHSVKHETSIEENMSSARRSVNPKRTTPPKKPCENDAKTIHHNWHSVEHETTVEEDNASSARRSVIPDDKRSTSVYGLGGDVNPPILFPTAQTRPVVEDANTVPPEYVRGGDLVPPAATSPSPKFTRANYVPPPGRTTVIGKAVTSTTEPSSQLAWSRLEKKRKLLEEQECGVTLDQRIVGGKTAALGAFPWIARLGYVRPGSQQVTYRCGGSLVSRQHVVTAAHCVTKLPAGLKLVTVRLGELDEDTDPDCNIAECADPVQDFTPHTITIHSSYDQPKYKNDIALIRLDRPADISVYVSLICLPFSDITKKNYTGQNVIAAGWGSTSMSVSSSKVLQWVKLKVLPTASCDALFLRRANVSVGRGQMCAAGSGGKDSCEGDSGGPLASLEQPSFRSIARHVLVGLVSFGARTCTTDTVPGVYTSVATYLDWLLDHIADHEV